MEAGNTVEGTKKQGGASGDQDLSMEEILQSIRRIIAEDDGEKKPDDAALSPISEKSSEDVPGSDVLELTEMLEDDGSVVSVQEAAAQAAPVAVAAPEKDVSKDSPGDVLAMINEALTPEPQPKAEEPAPVVVDSPKPAPKAAGNIPSSIIDSLLSTEAASAAAAQFKRLQSSDSSADTHVASPPFRSGNTVEDLVIDMLRPMMKDWLDNNLPQIVERIVEREVQKLTK